MANTTQVTKYVDLFFIRLIFRDGKYDGWYRPRFNGGLK